MPPKTEGVSKRARGDDDDHPQDLALPTYRIPSSSSSILDGALDKTEYQHGAIMKVTMKSFVTYEYCTFSPGPNMNMIIGPNGTGKSTIVCALALGLGWNTNLLGRAKDISEFVKHGADKGWIEIVLCNRHGSNVVIKRHINKNNNTSVWKINGENKTQKEVMKKVQSFDIQVDNLCQFLPQDRVSEFAQMTPQELLRETQRAVGGDEMLQAHLKMIELWDEHKTISKSLKDELDAISANEKRNAIIEKDVFRFQQREAVLRKVRLLEIWILYARYGVAKDEYNAVKEQRRVSFAMFKQLQTEVEPLEEKRNALERSEKACDTEKATLDKQYQKAANAIRAKGAAIETAEGESEELRKDLDRIYAKFQQRQTLITTLQRKIAAQQELIDGARSEQEINKEKDDLQDQLVGLQDETHASRDKISDLQTRQTEIVQESQRINGRMLDSRRRQVLWIGLEALDDIRNRRLEQLKSQDNDVYEAVMWLRANRQQFQKHVFEPVCLELNIKNTRIVNAVENTLRSHLKTFVCQTRADYDIMTQALLDTKKLRVNIIAPRPQELDLTKYQSPMSPDQLKQYGFNCFMLDAIDGPPALLAAMCSKAQIHAIPVSEAASVDFKAVRESKKFRRYATSTNLYTVSYSRHTGEALDTAAQLRPAQILTASVDHEERARLIREVDDMRSTLEQNETLIKELTAEENTRRKVHQEYMVRKDALTAARRELMMTLKRQEKYKIDLDTLKKDLQRRQNEPSSEEEEGKIQRVLQKMAAKRCQLVLEYLELAKASQQLFSRLTIATLNRLQAHTELQAVEADCRDKARQLRDMEDRYATVNAQYDEIKVRAKALLDKAKEEYNTLQPEDVPEFQALGKGLPLDRLEDMLAGETAKAALHYTPNQSVIEKYEQRQVEIKAAKDKVEVKQKRTAKIEAEIATVRGPWYARISEVVETISAEFSKSFAKIGCVGEVKLGEHEDYDKWCIEILVKFRDTEKLQKLTGQRQSGGERSVSTIMYLMALQSMSKVSFRVVDEINQGMDPRNERMVHTQLVEKACEAGTAQYFLITPKLLPNLDYHERMKVLCIYNGEWLDEGVMKWGRYLENHQRSKARRLV
ncbi:Structural maintenance of chromosomes protein 5 [Dissophora globulifera]|uniref:Structural maintenance of chromosomes protein 5 n=1 Tax=Dissophora globulifera TaxID=979702 RepID=A0A9P6R8A2_9FUNG|nr:Structural maintenance of chromosomes protein 5 [Dissophora globulifera]